MVRFNNSLQFLMSLEFRVRERERKSKIKEGRRFSYNFSSLSRTNPSQSGHFLFKIIISLLFKSFFQRKKKIFFRAYSIFSLFRFFFVLNYYYYYYIKSVFHSTIKKSNVIRTKTKKFFMSIDSRVCFFILFWQITTMTMQTQ